MRQNFCLQLIRVQLTRSDSPALLAQSLRTTSTLFSTLLPHLKLQLELFLSYLIDRLTPPTPVLLPHLNAPHALSGPDSPAVSTFSTVDGGVAIDGDATSTNGPSIETRTPTPSTPRPLSMLPPVLNETKELMLETLTQIAMRSSFMVDCWVNFDCSTESEDMFERLIAFLTRVSRVITSTSRK